MVMMILSLFLSFSPSTMAPTLRSSFSAFFRHLRSALVSPSGRMEMADMLVMSVCVSGRPSPIWQTKIRPISYSKSLVQHAIGEGWGGGDVWLIVMSKLLVQHVIGEGWRRGDIRLIIQSKLLVQYIIKITHLYELYYISCLLIQPIIIIFRPVIITLYHSLIQYVIIIIIITNINTHRS